MQWFQRERECQCDAWAMQRNHISVWKGYLRHTRSLAFVGLWHVRGVEKDCTYHISPWSLFSRVDYDDTSFKTAFLPSATMQCNDVIQIHQTKTTCLYMQRNVNQIEMFNLLLNDYFYLPFKGRRRVFRSECFFVNISFLSRSLNQKCA